MSTYDGYVGFIPQRLIDKYGGKSWVELALMLEKAEEMEMKRDLVEAKKERMKRIKLDLK